MRFSNINGKVSPGLGTNEDSFGYTEEAAWVIDGATGLTDTEYTEYKSDGLWYVEYVNELIEKNISKEESLNSIFKHIVGSAEQRFDEITEDMEEICEEEKPSAAISLVRHKEDKTEYFVLGDCSAIIERESGFSVILGEGPRELDEKVVEEMQRLMEGGLSYRESRKEVNDMLKEHRRMKNQEGGYWTLGFSEDAIDHASSGSFPSEELTQSYLFTDGFEPIVETYDVFRDWEAATNYLGQNGIDRAVRVLRAMEETDPECKKYPRLKPKDDAAIVKIK